MNTDPRMMQRALDLARLGRGFTGSNPMVGAVIVGPDGNIIGEGWHRRYGQGHAEVNAVASVADKELLRRSTMYVTLEPCSHWGKTPPCAKLIIDRGIPRVVIATADPFPEVSGRGIAMLREAGVEVDVGLMAEQARRLNKHFFTAHTLQRPYVTLKWAASADGWLDRRRLPGEPPAKFSTPLTQMLAHRERAAHSAILVGAGTIVADSPRLDLRLWPGLQPKAVVLDAHGLTHEGYAPGLSSPHAQERIVIPDHPAIGELLNDLYHRGITSLLVEGGSSVLRQFIDSGLWDEMRCEVSPVILGREGTAQAPPMPATPAFVEDIDGNRIYHFYNRTDTQMQ